MTPRLRLSLILQPLIALCGLGMFISGLVQVQETDADRGAWVLLVCGGVLTLSGLVVFGTLLWTVSRTRKTRSTDDSHPPG